MSSPVVIWEGSGIIGKKKIIYQWKFVLLPKVILPSWSSYRAVVLQALVTCFSVPYKVFLNCRDISTFSRHSVLFYIAVNCISFDVALENFILGIQLGWNSFFSVSNALDGTKMWQKGGARCGAWKCLCLLHKSTRDQ